jgi:multiple sugar transport system substrate-binding protein
MSSRSKPGTRGRSQGLCALSARRPRWPRITNRKSAIPNPKSQVPNPTSAVACCLLVLLGGCEGPQSDGNGSSAVAPLAGVRLRLVVVDDPELAAAAKRLQGEWSAQTGSELQVESVAEEQFDGTNLPTADAFICPSHQVGPLAERRLITPIPLSLLQGNVGDWSDVFELLRLSEATWVGEAVAVPFGSPVLVCYYRADLLEKLGRKPPETWAEYQQLAELLADRQNLGDAPPFGDAPWYGTVEPLAPAWAALVLLARSAPYAKHRDNYSTLFDIRTMEPLVAGPPFVRALEELVAAAKVGSPEQLRCDPTDARAAFWRGQCGMALTWPTAAGGGLAARPFGGTSEVPHRREARSIKIGFAELPGSTKVFNVRKHSWEGRAEDEDPHVPLVAAAGRIGAVSRNSAQPDAAFQLLFWLSGRQFGARVSASSPATTLFRRSHLQSPQTWVEQPIPPPAAARYAALAEKTLSRNQWVFALRIPGRLAYLSALDEAVHRAVRGEKPPGVALQEAATRWQEITQRLGREQQQAAYCHSLGREP